METRTHYIVLGVSRTEGSSGIRAAYRDLAKRLHPDVAGDGSTGAFQELTEAYDVLLDPERRSAYNEKLRTAEIGRRVRVRHRSPEPWMRDPASAFARPEGLRPSQDELYSRHLRNFTGRGASISGRIVSLSFELVLTPEEALAGCIVGMGLPVFSHCPNCGGSGRDWAFPCAPCRGQGLRIEAESSVRVKIPPMVRSGSIFELPLYGLGVHDIFLRLHVLVGG
jgi:DnaJ-class molecular chaperone